MVGVARRWTAVIWDFDGTLADTVPAIVAAHHVATESVLGYRLDEDVIRSRIGEPARRRIASLVGDRADEVFAAYDQCMRSYTPADTPLFPGTAELLEELAEGGVELGVVTSRQRAQMLPVLDYFEIGKLFSAIVCLEDTTAHKPDPSPIIRGLEELSVAPRRAGYVGDGVVDVRAAEAVGVGSVAVTWGAGTAANLRRARPSALVHTVSELRSCLLRATGTVATALDSPREVAS